MVKSRIRPAGSVVTCLTRLGEIRGDVIGAGRALKILEVASHAGCAVQVVVVVDVAVRALPRGHGMRSGQREAGGGMVELAVGPLHRVVALLAGGGEAGVRHGSGGIVVIGLMATNAGGDGDVVVVVDVTIGALPRRHSVCAGQREARLGMIKRGRLPSRSVVTGFARLREPALHMVGVRRAIEVRQVARNAGRRREIEIVVDVAIRALPRGHGVRARQREVYRGVIEGCG